MVETERLGGRDGSVAAISRSPESDLEAASTTDAWTTFLQSYDSLLTRELALQHPQFTRALRQLEREERLGQEKQSAQVLATLRLKDSRICELQKVVNEQREQLDVVLDELERRETKEDKGVQVEVQRTKDDVAVQTESAAREVQTMATQTDATGLETGVLELLGKLETELKTLEQRNTTLEQELQNRMPKKEDVRTEKDDRMRGCLDALQKGVEMMGLSCSCVDNPLAFFAGVPGDVKTCVNLEHRLEAQAVRLEHVQECLHMWRDAAVQCMHRQSGLESATKTPSISPPFTIRREETEGAGAVNCSVALRGALTQIRQQLLRHRDSDVHLLVKELATVLATTRSGAKIAAKMVQKWAGWEGKHLDEVRKLRQGLAEARAVDLSRRTALLKRVDLLEQRELDLQAEVNALNKKLEFGNSSALDVLAPSTKPGNVLRGTDECGGSLDYPHLLLKLATAEQSVLAKDEQLAAANETIRALSTPPQARGVAANPINRVAANLQRASTMKLDFFRGREKALVSVGQYFQREKQCLQLQSRLEAEQKLQAVAKAAKEVCERERDELSMKVEKLETEAILASISRGPATLEADKLVQNKTDESNSALLAAVRHIRLVEDDRKALRECLRHCQLQVSLAKQQRPTEDEPKCAAEPKEKAGVLAFVAEHHQQCVGEFQKLLNRPIRIQPAASVGYAANQDDDAGKQVAVEWTTLLRHYEALWVAFQFLYSHLGQLARLVASGRLPSDIGTDCGLILRTFGYQDSKADESGPYDIQQLKLKELEFELLKQNEKVLLLQQQLTGGEKERIVPRGSEDRNCCYGGEDERVRPSNTSVDCEFGRDGSSHSAELAHDSPTTDVKPFVAHTDTVRPFLASAKPREPPPRSASLSSNAPDSESLLERSRGNTAEFMDDRELTADAASELDECLAKCAYLASQNTKLTRQLRAEKATSKQCLKEAEMLRTERSAKPEVNSEPQNTLGLSRHQAPSAVMVDGVQSARIDPETTNTRSETSHVREKDYEALKEQLASREQENLALFQSLSTFKEKCAQMESMHQKELRVKAAEHAEDMESYMATVNQTLSRIEDDKHRLEAEVVGLRSKVQQLEQDAAQQQSQQVERSSKGTNTDPDASTTEPPDFVREKDLLKARVEDLELQLSRERKLTEVVERQKQLESRREEQQENEEKLDALRAKQEYETLCETVRQWRSKLQHELAEYEAVQRTSQLESDKRIGFLATCIEEFGRLADAAPTVSTKELYDAVMALARDPPRAAQRGEMGASVPSEKLLWQQKNAAGSGVSNASSARKDGWVDLEQQTLDEAEMSELLCWKLRASKLEAYVRSATVQNDTFEDTIRQLELRMRDLKENLSVRLAREAQLVSKLASLTSELASTKERAASLAEKYQQAAMELEKRQGEASVRGDETLRARMAVQRKTELLSQQKTRILTLQQELELAAKKVERLATAEKQAAGLQQKAKEHTQQLLHARQCYERCHDDNIQLSVHLEKLKERHAGVAARLKAARAENAHLRARCTELRSSARDSSRETSVDGKDNQRSHQGEADAVSVASLAEEARALKRRVLQKQDVIVSYKAKVAEYEAQVDRQRETMVKLARTNRDLQLQQRKREQEEQENSSAVYAEMETQLDTKQERLDGLRASVYDSFEAFVFCRPPKTPDREGSPASSSPSSPSVSPLTEGDSDKLFAIKRWTDFSVQDLEELKLAHGSQASRHKRASRTRGDGTASKRKAAAAALREVESALEINPEDCRAEICQLLQCLCG